MSPSNFWRRKPLEGVAEEANGSERLHRVLGPLSLTSLGVGAIIGAGIFAMTGRVAANDAGPAVVLSFAVAALACGLAALCYAEFAAMAPVAGSAYTYTYVTLGELLAWIIGWDLILEYAMSCAVVAAHWTSYLDEFLRTTIGWSLPATISSDPFTPISAVGLEVQSYANVPAMLIIAAVTIVLVLGIRESAFTNTLLVVLKLAVVLFVIVLGAGFVASSNWFGVPIDERKVSNLADYADRHPEFAQDLPPDAIGPWTSGANLQKTHPESLARLDQQEQNAVAALPDEMSRWGLLGPLGIKNLLQPLDARLRSPFLPYGVSGMMFGASIVFFAFIGFDSISTHAEEAVNPQRDVPLAILASLILCTLLYVLVSGVITGMEPYPQIDPDAAVASAFRKQAEKSQSFWLRCSTALIAAGALAGMTSVLLVTFLSQARVFLAMARDGLLPRSMFARLHPRYQTPHRATILVGGLMAVAAGFLPIRMLEEMVSIGTLLAFAFVCMAVLILRITRPDAVRPFRCPAVMVVAPLGILVTITLMLFLPLDTWGRLVIWLVIGLVIYLFYGRRHSLLRVERAGELPGQDFSGNV